MRNGDGVICLMHIHGGMDGGGCYHPCRASMNCSDESKGPPCTGWVEGMAPIFSRAACRCVWHLIQNDLIHGWSLDMKLGYYAQDHWPSSLREFILTARSLVLPREQKSPQSLDNADSTLLHTSSKSPSMWEPTAYSRLHLWKF